MPEKHALLSASSSERWVHCPASVRLTETLPDTSGAYAQEGKRAHKLAEEKLLHYKNSSVDITQKPDNDEMDRFTDDYRDYVISILNEELSKGWADVVVEQTLDYSEYAPEGFGTADAVVLSDDTLHIIDFKYGQNVEVSAKVNTQLLLYAAGAYERYSTIYGFDKIRVHIFQPRMSNISSDEYSVEEMFERLIPVSEQAKRAFDGVKVFSCGEWCRFCKLKTQCKHRAEYLQDKRSELEAYTLSNSDIEEILPKLDDLVSWAKELKEYAVKQMLDGTSYKGFKLVESRTNRKITNEIEVARRLLESGADDIYKEPSLKTITALEKQIGKKRFNELAGEFIEKPKGAPTIAKSTDRRKEYNPAEADFAEDLK